MSHNPIEELERIIKGRKSVRISREGDFIPASVMVILREEKDDYSMLFVKRREYATDIFSGHMAFPGGKMKEGDGSKLETAVRETLEETGIDIVKKGRILGELDDFNPINPRASHYVVTPYVALLVEDAEVRPNEEIAEAMWIPLSHFKDEGILEVRMVEKYGTVLKDFTFRYKGYVIWGMTGRILYNFLSLAGHLF